MDGAAHRRGVAAPLIEGGGVGLVRILLEDGRAASDLSRLAPPGATSGNSCLIALGLIALIVAAVGTCSVASYTMSQHANEIGNRLALGAKNSDIFKLAAHGSVAVGNAWSRREPRTRLARIAD